MFGRKVPSKTVELKYKGVEKNGDFTFIRKDVDFYNQKTTMLLLICTFTGVVILKI